MNTVNLIGRLTKDPEVKYTSSQMAVCKVNLAVDRMKKEQGADFIPVTFFGKTAETLETYKKKGDAIAVIGHIQTGSYEKDGHNVYTFDVIADRLEFVGGKTTDFNGERDKTDKQTDSNGEPTPKGFSAIEEDIPF